MRHLKRGGLLLAALALAGGATAAVSAVAAAGTHAAARTAGTRPAASPASTRSAAPSAVSPVSPAASGKHVGMLNAVSCDGGQCAAVGSWYDAPSSAHPLAERWTGASWQRQAAPDGPRDSYLAGVSCAPARGGALGCLAVGSPVLSSAGGAWRVIAKASSLDAASCGGPDACVAVGALPTGANPVFATWDGTALRSRRMHATPHAAQTVAVTGVSCPAADDCVAVGAYSYGVRAKPSAGARERTLAEAWNGRSWRVLPTANVSGWNQLTAVSCASPDSCTAVGSSENQFALAEHWNGATWRVESVPAFSHPASLGYVDLSGVSCPAARFCVAVGSYNGTIPLAETWNGSRWRLTRLPFAGGGTAAPTAVSCSSTANCVAVGTGPAGAPLAEVYSHGTWKQSTPRNPA